MKGDKAITNNIHVHAQKFMLAVFFFWKQHIPGRALLSPCSTLPRSGSIRYRSSALSSQRMVGIVSLLYHATYSHICCEIGRNKHSRDKILTFHFPDVSLPLVPPPSPPDTGLLHLMLMSGWFLLPPQD